MKKRQQFAAGGEWGDAALLNGVPHLGKARGDGRVAVKTFFQAKGDKLAHPVKGLQAAARGEVA